MDNNQVNGTIPSNIFSNARFAPSGGVLLNFTATNNRLTGSVPASLLTFNTATAGVYASYEYFFIRLRNNTLDGMIDKDLMRYVNWTLVTWGTIDLSDNSLTGNIPDNLFRYEVPRGYNVHFNVSYNSFGGTIPDSFLQSINPGSGLYPMPSYISEIPSAVFLIFDHAGLTGTLNIPNFNSRVACQSLNLSITAVNNNFGRIYIDEGLTSGLFALNLTNNMNAHGTLPISLFVNPSQLAILKAANTSVDSVFPDIGSDLTTAMQVLILDNTLLDFCDPSRSLWSSTTLQTCSLLQTGASECLDRYPSTCNISAMSPDRVKSPLPPTSPISPSSPQCSESTRPDPSFVCINGSWTSTTVTTPILTIPSGAKTTVIQGNLTSSQVIIRGIGSTLVVVGCSTNLTLVTIELTPEDLEKIGKTKTQALLSADPSCTNMSAIEVVSTLKGSSCRKLATSKSVSGMTLSGVFVVDSSSCNRWWIILVSVICALVVVAVIVVIVVVLFCCGPKSIEHYRKKDS